MGFCLYVSLYNIIKIIFWFLFSVKKFIIGMNKPTHFAETKKKQNKKKKQKKKKKKHTHTHTQKKKEKNKNKQKTMWTLIHT